VKGEQTLTGKRVGASETLISMPPREDSARSGKRPAKADRPDQSDKVS
jgi:hypothetical protein